MTLAGELLRAMAGHELELEYQPPGQGEITTGKIIVHRDFGALESPFTRGLLQPAAFIPVAEITGAICPSATGCSTRPARQVKAWRVPGTPPFPPLPSISHSTS